MVTGTLFLTVASQTVALGLAFRPGGASPICTSKVSFSTRRETATRAAESAMLVSPIFLSMALALLPTACAMPLMTTWGV